MYDIVGILEWLLEMEMEKDAAGINTKYVDKLAFLILKYSREQKKHPEGTLKISSG